MESSRGLMRAPMTQAFRHIPAKMTFAPFQSYVSEMRFVLVLKYKQVGAKGGPLVD